MPEQFLHGVEVVELSSGAKPIKTVKSSVIGLVGTAPKADVDAFPLNTPTLIAGSRLEAAKLGTTGTLPPAMDDIFDQAGAMVVVVRIEEGADKAATVSNVIGGVDAVTEEYTGLHALTAAKAMLGAEPRIIIAPEFSSEKAVAVEMEVISTSLKAAAIVDGPNTTDAEAILYKKELSSKRTYVIDPNVKVWDTVTSTEVERPASARVAGIIARTDNEKGFWFSPSNKPILGITGTSRPVAFRLGDTNCRANYLNENNVSTIINEQGYRLWGNRTVTGDFLCVVRTADLINDSIQRAHMELLDLPITKTYLEELTERVNNYLSHLQAIGAIIGGSCWADPDLNTPDQLAQGKVYVDFDFTAPAPAEHITFRSHLVNDYYELLFK